MASGNAFTLYGTYGLSFTDNYGAAITGGAFGIDARNDGMGALSVTAAGAVTGGRNGIVTLTGVGKSSTITLNDGASVAAASGAAITNDVSNSTVTVNTGASANSAIRLGGGSDSLTFDGGDFSGVTALDGGHGTGDALGFGAGAASLADATILEILSFGGFVPTVGDSFDILIADEISLTSPSNLTFDFAIGGFWTTGIFDVGGRDALRLQAVAAVPVPPGLAMFGSVLASLFGLGWARRRRQRLAV